MKGLARMYVWWPGLNKDIEDLVLTCSQCQANQPVPPAAPLCPWSWPTRLWSRLHADYTGPLYGHMFLVVIDAHFKWIKAFCVSSATSSIMIDKLRMLFAQFGLPETIVSDNGSCFVNKEFESFLQSYGIEHITTAPYHPSLNGLAVRAVQVLKSGLMQILPLCYLHLVAVSRSYTCAQDGLDTNANTSLALMVVIACCNLRW